MKIRTGFVSNSSSSSFIIGVDKETAINNENLMVEIKIKIPLKRLQCEEFRNADEFLDYIINDYYCYDSKEEALEAFAKNPKSDMAKTYNFIINNPDAFIYEMTASPNDGDYASLFYGDTELVEEIGKNKGFTVLANEE